jgi:hypothetical protein
MRKTKAKIKHNTLPVKIMFKLLYGQEGIKHRFLSEKEAEVSITSGPLAKSLYVSVSTLLSQIAYLKILGLVTRAEQLKRGEYILKVKLPENLDLL